VAAGRVHRTQEAVAAWAAGRLLRRVLLLVPVHLLVGHTVFRGANG
jgi:hypothetical protein